MTIAELLKNIGVAEDKMEDAEKAVKGEGFAPFERAVRSCLDCYMEKAKYACFGENVLIRYLYQIEEQST